MDRFLPDGRSPHDDMFWVILSAIYVTAHAASLQNAYLPPESAKDAGGRDDDLQVPLEPPYVDPYSDNRHLVSETDQPQYGRGYYRRTNRPMRQRPPTQDDDKKFVDLPEKSRFLYGSYSYTGPDNVLVTVTYTADRKKGTGGRRADENDYDDYRFVDDGDDYFNLEGGVVPTPPSLPKELRKAFAFHRMNYTPEAWKDDGKRSGPARKKSQKEKPGQKPVIHQGYSYPKAGPY